MLETGIRQAATVLLESAIRIAPPSAQEWGMAMRGELSQVESPWDGTLWALGGTTVLVKETLVSLVVPNSLVPDGGLFARSPALRRAATVIGAAGVLAALLFFASPPYRQAFRVGISPWLSMLHAVSTDPQGSIQIVARKAAIRHDAEGLAFAAVRTENTAESLRLAKAAVKLDPKLTWIYGVLAQRSPANSEVVSAIPPLLAADPQNSLLYIVAAESLTQRGSKVDVVSNPSWRDEMAGAFDSSKFDDYSDRVARLTQTVVPRYRLYDPYEVEERNGLQPQFLLKNTETYAEFLFDDGGRMDKSAAPSTGRGQYWAVARFGQMLDSQAHTPFEHSIGIRLQSLAYRRLEKSSSLKGDREQAALFTYLAAKFDSVETRGTDPDRESTFGRETALRNAAVVEVSVLMMVVFLVFVAVAGTILIVANRRNAGAGARRARPIAVIVLLTSSFGVLFSSVTLYLTYRPYWYIFQTSIATGEGTRTPDLHEFLSFTQVLPGFPHRLSALMGALIYSGSPGFLFYVWAGAALFGVIGLALIILRRFTSRTTNLPK